MIPRTPGINTATDTSAARRSARANHRAPLITSNSNAGRRTLERQCKEEVATALARHGGHSNRVRAGDRDRQLSRGASSVGSDREQELAAFALGNGRGSDGDGVRPWCGQGRWRYWCARRRGGWWDCSGWAGGCHRHWTARPRAELADDWRIGERRREWISWDIGSLAPGEEWHRVECVWRHVQAERRKLGEDVVENWCRVLASCNVVYSVLRAGGQTHSNVSGGRTRTCSTKTEHCTASRRCSLRLNQDQIPFSLYTGARVHIKCEPLQCGCRVRDESRSACLRYFDIDGGVGNGVVDRLNVHISRLRSWRSIQADVGH